MLIKSPLFICFKCRILRSADLFLPPYIEQGGFHICMTSAKYSNFLPPCHCQKSADFVPFVCFLGTPSPHPLRTSFMEAPPSVTGYAKNGGKALKVFVATRPCPSSAPVVDFRVFLNFRDDHAAWGLQILLRKCDGRHTCHKRESLGCVNSPHSQRQPGCCITQPIIYLFDMSACICRIYSWWFAVHWKRYS